MSVIISGSTGIARPLGSAGSPSDVNTSDATTGLYFPASNTVGIATAGTNALYIDASQNVGIGTTSPTSVSTYGALSVNGSGGGLLDLMVGGTYKMRLAASSASGIIYTNGAIPLVLAPNLTEAARIDSSGNLLVGYTSSNGSYKLQVNSQIFATSSTIATSDANYKTNITPLTGALNLVQKLNPVSFNWKKHEVHNFDTETPTVGFLAQEVQSALAGQPYVNSIVKQSEVTLPDDTKQSFLGIAEGNMVALLTKALQETVAKIDALETEVTALKAKVGA